MLNVQEKEKKLNAKIKTLENFLYNAILCWFANMGDEYDGLEDEAFVRRVCAETGMTRSKYERLITGNTEEHNWN